MPGAEKRYKNAIHCLRTTIKEEGVRGLYKGTLSPLLLSGFVCAFQFSAYQKAKSIFEVKPPISLNFSSKKTRGTTIAPRILRQVCSQVLFPRPLPPQSSIFGSEYRLKLEISQSYIAAQWTHF